MQGKIFTFHNQSKKLLRFSNFDTTLFGIGLFIFQNVILSPFL